MTKYYKYLDSHSLLGSCVRYVEANEDGWSLREVWVNGALTLGSNLNYFNQGLMMSDTQIDYEDCEEVMPSDEAEFLSRWNLHLKNYEKHWQVTKALARIGSAVHGHILWFLRQGTIIDCGAGVIGVADTQACKMSLPDGLLGSKQAITGFVSGYDDTNQWLKIDSPQIHLQ